MLKYRYTVESWKFEADNVKAPLEKAEYLVEGIWNNCSDVIEEWGIVEIEESIEAFTPKFEYVEQFQASSEAEITNLSVLDVEAMEFLIISPAKLMARIDKQARFARKGIKEIAAITIK